MGSNSLKLEPQEDRISDLPDVIIQHILSFLPLTKEAIQTGILSKAWRNQWTHVPILIFNSTGKNDENFSQFIDKTLTLHDCSNIKKFHMEYDCRSEEEDSLTSKIRFTTTKDVEELVLRPVMYSIDDEEWELNPYELPEFLYDNGSLVKLELFQCCFVLNTSINWTRLKELKLDCYSIRYDSIMEKVVSGCPVLESLELTECICFDNMVITSKSLKKLIFVDTLSRNESDRLEISCPNLEELSIVELEDWCKACPDLPRTTIENVLSSSLLLHTLVVPHCSLDSSVIASKSLKKLVLGEIYGISDNFEISCPQLEELNLYEFVVRRYNFVDSDSYLRWVECMTKKIFGQLQKLQNVKLLEIGSWLIMNLSRLEAEEDLPLLNCKCLTVNGFIFDERLPGIIRAIRCSPVLEKIVIKLHPEKSGDVVYDCSKEIYSNSYGTFFRCCSVSNLKTVKIIGISERHDKHTHLVFKFIEFLLQNAKLLEKMVVILADCGTDFLFDVSKQLLSFPRCSPLTIIELLRSELPNSII